MNVYSFIHRCTVATALCLFLLLALSFSACVCMYIYGYIDLLVCIFMRTVELLIIAPKLFSKRLRLSIVCHSVCVSVFLGYSITLGGNETSITMTNLEPGELHRYEYSV